MSTGPGPTHKADGTADASVDDIADLLVEDDAPSSHGAKEEVSDDSLDVMLETPGPALASSFMPPPPSPVDDVAEEGENGEEGEGSTNLAYEDLLAKLVLPAKTAEPQPEMAEAVGPLPPPEAINPLVTSPLPPAPALSPTPTPALFRRPSSQSLQIAPPADERTLVTENPLVAEEQEAAFREGRAATREPPRMVHESLLPMPTEPVAMSSVNGAAKSRLFYLMAGGALVLFGMFLAVVVLKLLMPTPVPQAPAVVVPAAPPPPPAAPAHVEPLPPSTPPAAAEPVAAEPPAAAELEPSAAAPAPAPSVEPGKAPVRVHKPAAHARPTRAVAPKAAAPKPAATPKPAPTPKAAATKPAKATTGKKPSKGSGYADPFDN